MTKLIILTEKMSPDWTILPAANVVQMWCKCASIKICVLGVTPPNNAYKIAEPSF